MKKNKGLWLVMHFHLGLLNSGWYFGSTLLKSKQWYINLVSNPNKSTMTEFQGMFMWELI